MAGVKTALARCFGASCATAAAAALLVGLSGCEPIALRGLLDKLANGTTHLYFSERDAGRISVAETGGLNVFEIGGLGAVQPIMLAADLGGERLYWSDHDGAKYLIRRAGLDGSNAQTIYSEAGSLFARGICVVPALSQVFWTVPGQGYIRWANLDGSGPGYQNWSPDTPYDVLVRLDPSAPDGVGWIYATSWGAGRIGRMAIDLSDLEWMVEGLSSPMDLAYDPVSNLLYWSEDTGGIYRINADTAPPDLSTLETVVSASAADSPRDLALDVANGKIYWVSDADSDIRRANLDGSGVEVLIDGLTTPRGIALDLRPR